MSLCNDSKWYEWAVEKYESGCLVLDTEATGCSIKTDDVIDVALVAFPSGEVVFQSLVRPAQSISRFAMEVHGISYNMLRDQPVLEDVWDKISSIIEGKNILAYNSNFDFNILKNNCLRRSLSFPDAEWECLMKAYKGYKLESKYTSLANACQELSVKAGSHRAVSDALAAARVLYRMCQRY